MRHLLLIGVSILAFSEPLTGQTWRWATSVADIRYHNGVPQAYNSRFCILADKPGINISLSGGATQALITSETSAWSAYLANGVHTLNEGCYTHAVGNWYAGGGALPHSQVTYHLRYIAGSVALPGTPRSGHNEVGRSLIDRGTSNLGNLTGRFLVDVYGVDDRITVRVNGRDVQVVNYANFRVFEVTQHLRNGANTVRITGRDKHRGRCWHIAYRVGDETQWRYNDNYANTNCNMRSGWKTLYRKTFQFNFTL